MSRREYARERHFDRAPEPKPIPRRGTPEGALRFVVQKHRASRLHYDFRLEWNGALLSWAVPKGPSMDPDVKRLAVAVEDHPLDYARFEGTIPAKEYGGGTVMVWDEGTYEPESPDVGQSWWRGEIKFVLRGRKLEGTWVLLRTGDASSTSWLLIKRRDAAATKADVLAEKPRSVVSKRLMAQIAFDGKGDTDRAATADPPEALRELLRQSSKSTSGARKKATARVRGAAARPAKAKLR